MLSKNCLGCGKLFLKNRRSITTWNRLKNCSQECRNKLYPVFLPKNCLGCGKLLDKRNHSISTWNKLKNCSWDCYLKNHIPWNKGKISSKPKVELYVQKQCNFCKKEFTILKYKYTARYCGEQCYYDSLKGVPGRWLGKKRPEFCGSNNPLWKGGITKLQDQVRTCLEMKQWKRKILIRDNFHCIWGGKEHGNKLAVDHYPTQFAQVLENNNITTLEQALQCSQLWDINNGRTLCIPCHKKTDTYLKRINGNYERDFSLGRWWVPL